MPSFKYLALWGGVAFGLVVIFAALQPDRSVRVNEITYSRMMQEVASGSVASVTTMGDSARGRFKGGGDFVAYVPSGAMADTVRQLLEADVEVRAARPADGPSLTDILLGIMPMVLLIGAWFFYMRQMKSKGGDPSQGWPPNQNWP